MFKKISVVLCAGLFATAFAAGCKKDKKDGEGAAATASCEGVAAKIADHMHKEMMGGDMDMSKMPPEAKKAMEDGMKKVPAAIIQACKDDKWSKEALECAAKAKDPKTECDGKLTPEQEEHMGMAAMTAMGMGDMAKMMGHDMGADTDVAGTADGSGTGTGTGSAGTAEPPPVAPGKFPATCQGVADRAKADMAGQLPPGAPADIVDKFTAVIAKACTDDKWAQDVIDCGVNAADPKDECQGKLTPEQKAHIEAEQEKLAKEMMEAMAAAGGGDGAGGGGMAAGGSSGIKECDDFMAAVKKLSECDKIPADQKAGMEQMAGAFGALSTLPDDQKASYAEQCKQGIEGMAQMAKAYGC